MDNPGRDRTLLALLLVACCVSVAAATRYGGVVLAVWLFMIPSTVFVGCVLAPWFRLPFWLGVVAVIATAIGLAAALPVGL